MPPHPTRMGANGVADEGADLKNGATEATEQTKKPNIFSVLFVISVAPFLRSGTSEILLDV